MFEKCENVLTSVGKLMKASPLKSWAALYVCRYQTWLNWLKFGKNSQNCVKIVFKKCLKMCESVCESAKNYPWNHFLWDMFFDTKHVQIGLNLLKIAKIVWKVW